MSSDRLRRIEALYHEALSRSHETRASFLAAACGSDTTLLRELESLLRHASTRDGFLEHSIIAALRLVPGQTLGHYTVIGQLGAGGMGEVYRGRDTLLNRDIAIKILPLALAGDLERLQRFEQEARTVAALTHPNIVTIHAISHIGELHFLILELVEGAPLAEQIPRDGMPVDRLVDIAVQLADAVAAAHARGVVHRDLKPANVMLTPDGRVKVLDFGLAKLKPVAHAGDLIEHPTTLTGDGRLAGTVAYMSPEQAEGRDVDHRSDIFSLGVLLYELATGERPFKGDTRQALLSAILNETPQSPSERKPSCALGLSQIVLRCLAKDLKNRYQSAFELINDLKRFRRAIGGGSHVS